MDFDMSDKQKEWLNRVQAFMNTHVRPAVPIYKKQDAEGPRWKVIPILEELKKKAKAEGLWNMFMPPNAHEDDEFRGAGLTNLEYALLAEEMGHIAWASEVFNCSAPDTGNMEVFMRYGTQGAEAEVAAAADGRRDPLRLPDDRAGGGLVGRHQHRDPHREGRRPLRHQRPQMVVVGRRRSPLQDRDPDGQDRSEGARKHQQQSQILVPLDTPGIKVEKMLPVFGFDDAPHGHAQVLLENVRVPKENILLGEGRGFEIAQGRLGPGRIHHCMRTIGKAEEALEKMVKRLSSRTAFGKKIIEHSIWEQRIAEARTDIEMNRLLCLKAADMMDKVGNKTAQLEIAMIKVAAPNMALKIIDNAIQAYGGAGVSDDAGLAQDYAHIRTLRLADGPDEVHNRAIARLELRKYANARTSTNGSSHGWRSPKTISTEEISRERHRGRRRQERRRILGHQGSRGASSHRRGAASTAGCARMSRAIRDR